VGLFARIEFLPDHDELASFLNYKTVKLIKNLGDGMWRVEFVSPDSALDFNINRPFFVRSFVGMTDVVLRPNMSEQVKKERLNWCRCEANQLVDKKTRCGQPRINMSEDYLTLLPHLNKVKERFLGMKDPCLIYKDGEIGKFERLREHRTLFPSPALMDDGYWTASFD